MRIIILGAGQVGGGIADFLAREGNDITLVDRSAERLADLAGPGIRVLAGHAAHPETLIQAGIEDADMILAVTDSDETNMVACQVARTLFNTPKRLARVRAPDFHGRPGLFGPDGVPVDFIISPEQLVTTFIVDLIDQPGALQSLDFAGGRARLVAARADHGGALIGHELASIRLRLPAIGLRVVAIFRRGRALAPDGRVRIEVGDEVFLVAARADITAVTTLFRRVRRDHGRVFIAGGGNIGKRLAEMLEPRYRVKLIERDGARCRALAETLERTMVLHGDAVDESLCIEENIERANVFCAVTNDDETNILAAMQAKRLGARRVLALVNNPAYVDIIQGGGIDIAVSPSQVTIGALLTHIRRGDVVAAHSLRRGAAEAIEAVAHGDADTSRVVGRRLDELPLPDGTTIGAIARGDRLLFPGHDTRIETGDHVILFLADKRRISEVERLFQVGIGYL